MGVTNLPKRAQPIGVKWVYKKKTNAEGEVERYKARLIVKGYKQKEGIFALVTRIETIRLLISLAAQHRWTILKMDVKSPFLNGVLEEEVYVEQPLGYMRRGEEKKVLRLKKALYGLKQAPRAWNERIDTYFKKNGYEEGVRDDRLRSYEVFPWFRSCSREGRHLCVARKVCNPVSTPMEPGKNLSKYVDGDRVDASKYRSLIGSLRYLTNTKPDLMLSVGITSRYMEEPTYTHWKALKRILRYVRRIVSLGLMYTRTDDYRLVRYLDSDWCGDVDDGKARMDMYSSWGARRSPEFQRNNPL